MSVLSIHSFPKRRKYGLERHFFDNFDVCKKCTLVQQDPACWTWMSYSNFKNLCLQCTPSDGECKKWASVQHCFHVSHPTPTPWDKCGHLRWHKDDSLLIIHPDISAPLPDPFLKEAFARKVRVDKRLEKPFPADDECRKTKKSSTEDRILTSDIFQTIIDGVDRQSTSDIHRP